DGRVEVGGDFFFQAEDGIRDFHVTGVQTCALPISGPSWGPGRCVAAGMPASRLVLDVGQGPQVELDDLGVAGQLLTGAGVGVLRSEERRVGKEWASRGWPWQATGKRTTRES